MCETKKEVEYNLLKELRGEYSAFFVFCWLKHFVGENNICVKANGTNYTVNDLADDLVLSKQAVYRNLQKLKELNIVANAYNFDGKCLVLNPHYCFVGECERKIYSLFDR